MKVERRFWPVIGLFIGFFVLGLIALSGRQSSPGAAIPSPAPTVTTAPSDTAMPSPAPTVTILAKPPSCLPVVSFEDLERYRKAGDELADAFCRQYQGDKVKIMGPFTRESTDGERLQATLNDFYKATGITIEY